MLLVVRQFNLESKRRKILLATMFTLVGGFFSCGYPDSPIRKFGPKETTDLVVVFKEGVSKDTINEFDETVISTPNESGTGIWSLPGISSGYLSSKNGYDFKGINFSDDSTKEQQQFVKQRVLTSDIVHCIRENVRPADLAKVPCESSDDP